MCLAMLSPEFFAAPDCRQEIFRAAREAARAGDDFIVPIIFGPPPPNLRIGVPHGNIFGSHNDDVEKFNVVSLKSSDLFLKNKRPRF